MNAKLTVSIFVSLSMIKITILYLKLNTVLETKTIEDNYFTSSELACTESIYLLVF